VLNERSSPDRPWKAGAAIGAAAVAFLLAAPYTWLDMPAFLDGFAAQFARFAAHVHGGDAGWLLYLKHLSVPGPLWLPLAATGIAVLLWRSPARVRWAPAVVFTAAYFYMLSTHGHAFGRYALPLLPMLSLFAAVGLVEILRQAQRVHALARPSAQLALVGLAIVVVLYAPTVMTVRWLDAQKRSDTRAIAADWLKNSAPKGTRLAVENSGPTYLDAAGFTVVGTELLLDHDADWYRSRADYLIVSAADLERYADYLKAGPTVFQINPTPQRWGPPIRIIRIW